jgi:hypothetical protein
MDIKILRDLCEAYSGVYTPQELTEEQIWEEVENWVNSLIEEGYDLSDYSWEEMYEAYIEEVWGAQRYQRTGPSLSSKVKGLFKSGADSTPRTTGIYGQPTKKPEAPNPATTPAATTPAATTPAATTPAATTPAAPTNRPVTTAPTSAKPAAPAPAGQTGDKAKDMATFSKANPKLAAASAERDRTRGTSATTNPLMKDMKSRLPAPKPASGNTLSQTAAAASKPAAFNPTSSAPKPSTPPAAASSTSPVNKARGSSKPGSIVSSYQWGSTSKLVDDIANLYQSVYEAKKVDQDGDGDNDFADVRIARLIASGMSKEEAIAKVKNKPYNEEVEIDEARTTVASPGDNGRRPHKKTRGAKNEKEYMAGRSDAGKRISGDDIVGPRYYTLGRSRGAGLDAPTKPGNKPENTPKATKGELDYARNRHKYVSGKSWNKFGGPKGLPEDFELWVSNLLEEGYDLSDYTWDEIVEIYEDYKPWDFGPKQKAQAKHSQLVQRKKAGGSPRGTATRANKIASVGREMRTTLDKNSAATGANPAKQGLQPATQRHTVAAMRGAGGGTTATKAYNVKPLKSSRGGSSSLGGVGNASGTQRYTPGAGGRYGLAGTGLADEFELWVQELINEGYDLSDYTWDEIVEIYEETEEEKKKNERRARVAELQASGRVMTSSRRTSERAKERREEQKAERLERLANAALEDERGAKGRSSTPMGSTQPTSKESAPKANRKLSSSMKKDTLASKADELLRMLQNENFQLWTNELLDEGYELDNWTDEELVELYIEIFG